MSPALDLHDVDTVSHDLYNLARVSCGWICALLGTGPAQRFTTAATEPTVDLRHIITAGPVEETTVDRDLLMTFHSGRQEIFCLDDLDDLHDLGHDLSQVWQNEAQGEKY